MKASNLNEALPYDKDNNTATPYYIRTASVVEENVECHFLDLEDRLISMVEQADSVFGAVAWLTNFRILRALSELKAVSIVVQKEDFLRPDSLGNYAGWKTELHKMYTALPHVAWRYEIPGNVLSHMEVAGVQEVEAVRCAGISSDSKAKACPRMHHKFLVFARATTDPKDDQMLIHEPYAVWTGSFNLTQNATNSLENVVVIRTPSIVTAYMNEYNRVAAISEPLNWQHTWVEPEWRIGT